MRVNIICTDVGWIYSKFVDMFSKYSKHEILLNSKESCDVYYYIPYYELPKEKHTKRPCCVWASHQETKSPLKEKFISASKQADFAISHSKKYADMLIQHGVKNVKQIMPGVDHLKYKIRDTERLSKTEKLIIGYSGRIYISSGRKNPKLLKKISELPFVEFRSTGGKMKLSDLPKFYSNCDIIVSPSTVEGGPMSILESLSCGTPIMCFKDVGVAQEFNTGVIKIDPKDKVDDFISRLEIIHRTKSYLHYRKPGVMNQMRKQVKDKTWELFVRRHEWVFDEIVNR